MSLANDIMRKHGNISPPSKRKAPATYIQVAKRPKVKDKKFPGVSVSIRYDNKTVIYRAYTTVDKKMVNLGEFRTAERANLAYRLFCLWQRKGFTDAPHKPSIRLYGNR